MEPTADAGLTRLSDAQRAACTHERARIHVNFVFFEDLKQQVAEIQILCETCAEKFRFKGVPQAGYRFDGPSVSIDETTLHCPIEPEGLTQLRAGVSYQFPAPPRMA